MSRLSDYAKFDRLDDDSSSDDGEERGARPAARKEGQQQQWRQEDPSPEPPAAARIRRHPTNARRFVFEHAGRPIYEWEQSLQEVVLYVPAPPAPSSSCSKDGIVCNIAARHLQLGLRGHDRFFLDEDTAGAVDTTESTWCIEEDDGASQIVIYLQKMAKGSVWPSALKGRTAATTAELDPLSLQQVQKQIMLERFQEENPGMDFSGAEISGSVPDPRSFMGGVRYD